MKLTSSRKRISRQWLPVDTGIVHQHQNGGGCPTTLLVLLSYTVFKMQVIVMKEPARRLQRWSVAVSCFASMSQAPLVVLSSLCKLPRQGVSWYVRLCTSKHRKHYP